MKRTAGILAAVALSGALLAGCSSTTDDRSTGNGKAADADKDVSNVIIWHNADNVPNVATFCVGQFHFATTLTGNGGAASNKTSLVLLPDSETACGR